MLKRLGHVGFLILFLFSVAGCSGGEELLQNFRFSYEPQFAAYTGGTGTAGNLGGAWNIAFSRAIRTGGEIRAATTYQFVAQQLSAGKAIGFSLNPETRASAYIEIFLSGSAIDVRVNEYNPADDRVVRYIAQGTFDLGTRAISTTTFSVEVFDAGSKQDGTGTWSGFVTDVASPGFEPLGDGMVDGIKFVLADETARGDMELWGSMDLVISGSTLTGTATVKITNDERVDITEGTLAVSGTRAGGAAGTVFTLAITGNVGGETFSGNGTLTGIATGTDTRFPGTDLLGGEILIQSGNTTNAIWRARKFAGTLGRSMF